MSANETNFAVVVRGYDRASVDDAILDLRKEILNLSALNSQLASELRQANKTVEDQARQLAEASEPSYGGLGARVALILSTAEDQTQLRCAARSPVSQELQRRSFDWRYHTCSNHWLFVARPAKRHANSNYNARRGSTPVGAYDAANQAHFGRNCL